MFHWGNSWGKIVKPRFGMQGRHDSLLLLFVLRHPFGVVRKQDLHAMAEQFGDPDRTQAEDLRRYTAYSARRASSRQ